jgi:hypothetical protein
MVLQAIDGSLAVLGKEVGEALYHHIERTYGIGREDIPERIIEFHNALEHLLGSGAKVFEKLVAKSLYGKLELNFEERRNWTLVDYLDHIKKGERK